MAAVLVPDDVADDLRAALRAMLTPGQRRLHWRADSDGRRAKITQEMANLGLTGPVAVRQPIDPRRQERARRLCLRLLLWELEQRSVTDAFLESRGSQDAADRQLFLAGQRSGSVARSWAYEFGSPLAEPLLWMPDYVAGVVSLARWSADDRHLLTHGGQVESFDAGSGT